MTTNNDPNKVSIRPGFWFLCFGVLPLACALVAGSIGVAGGALLWLIPVARFSVSEAIFVGLVFAILGLCYSLARAWRMARAAISVASAANSTST